MANITHTVSIRADTSQAKASIQDLQTQLSSLVSVPVGVDATGLQSAKTTILELGQNLRAAMNPNTGKLDLSVFSRALKDSNKTILDYKNALFSMGTQGQQAFLSLANTIAAAEAPTNRLNAKVLQFGKTLKNTINWQLSSSLIHGVIGQVNQAINYAEKLNTSLNNIQIITGQNNDKMAEFARQANQTAKQLSTTTTEYTNASLIYYQQGLNDKEVAARTETTLKMANVTRQSAQVVSDQMTAIWNNFAEGSGNLEHYADVITALGAATASSSAEISAGLNKFAAIGKTVGLSYDYATTALATIIATTRQGADTVGTGLRTLFSRLEGLSLGETLEDGVNLNKYSSALAKVGVNIQDQYGQIKNMDQILDELGAKWGTISKEQQIALAQTVGGVRQYTNLIALMDNWQFFQRNLQVAQGADGTLQTQAERYAQSWEAARKRVQTSAEGIYDSLIDDQAIIKVTNVFAGFLDVINGLVAGFGGLKGIIPIVSSLLLNSFAKNMPQFLGDISNNFRVLTGRSAKDMTNMQGNLTGILEQIKNSSPDPIYQQQIQKIIDTNKMNRSLAMNANRMSDADQAAYRFQMAAREAEHDAYIQAMQRTQQAQAAYDQTSNLSFLKSRKIPVTLSEEQKEQVLQAGQEVAQDASSILNRAIEIASPKINETRAKYSSQISDINSRMNQIISNNREISTEFARRFSPADSRLNVLSNILSEENLRKQWPGVWEDLDRANAAKAALPKNATTAEINAVQRRINAATKAIDNLIVDNGRGERQSVKSLREELKAEEKAQSDLRKQAANNNIEFNKLREKRQKLTEEQDQALEQINNNALKNAQAENDKQVAKAEADAKAELLAKKEEESQIIKSQNLGALLQKNDKDFYDRLLTEKGYKEILSGTAKDNEGNAITELTRENLLKVRGQGSFISTADNKIFEQIQKTAYQDFMKASMKQGALNAATEDVSNFSKNLQQMLATPEVKPEQVSAYTQEFVSSIQQALKAQDISIDNSLLEKLIGAEPGKIDSIVAEIKANLEAALKSAGADVDAAEQILNNAGFQLGTKEHFEAGEKARGVGAAQYYQDRTPKPREKTDEAKPTQALSTSLTQVASAAMSLYSAFQSASNAVEVFSDTTKNGLSQFGSVLSTISSTLMAGGMLGNALEGLGAGASSGPAGLVISILTMAAGILAGVIEQNKISDQKDAQSLVEQGQAALDRLEATAELKKSQENLINAYNQTAKDLEKGQATQAQLTAAQEELVQALTQTAEGYSNAGAIASVLAGEMDQAQSILDYNRAEQIRKDKAVAETGLNNYIVSQNNSIPTKGISTIVGAISGLSSYSGGLGMNAIAEPLVAEILRQYSDSFTELSNYDFIIPSNIQDKTASNEQIYDFILDAEAAYNQMVTAGLTGNGVSTLGEIVSYFKNYKEFYEQIRALNIEELMLGQATTVKNIGRANEEITNVQSYIEYRKNAQAELARAYQLEEGTTAYDEMVKALDAELSTIAAVTDNDLGNLQYIHQGIQGVIEYQKSRAGEEEKINETQLTNWLADAYAKYGNAIFELGMQVVLSPDANSLEQSLGSYLDLLQLTADSNKIKIQMELAKNFDLDENSTASAWGKFGSELDKETWQKAIGDEFLTFNDDGSIKGFNYAAFSTLTDEIRQNYMDQYYDYLENEYYSPGGILDQEIAERERLLTDETDAESIISRKNAALKAFGKSYNTGLAGAHRDIKHNMITTEYSNIEAYYAAKDSGNQVKISDFDNIFDERQRNALDRNRERVEAAVQAYKDLLAIEQEESAAQKKNDEARAERDAWDQIGFRSQLVKEAEAQGIDYNEVQQYAAALRETQSWQEAFADAQNNIAEASERAALSILETENAIASISNKYSEWNTILSSNASQLKKQAIYDEIAKKIKQLLIPTGQVTVGFAKFADNMGLVYKAGQGDKEAILEMGEALWAYNKIGEKSAEDIREQYGDTEEAVTAMIEQATTSLQNYYKNQTDANGEAVTAASDLATVTEFLATAQEGQALSAEAQAAAERLYTAEFQRAIDQEMEAPQALQAATDAMNEIGLDMPTPEVVEQPMTSESSLSRTGIIGIATDNEGVEYEEGETVTTSDTSTETVPFLDFSGKGNASAQTPTNTKPKGGGGGGGKKKKDSKKPDTGTRYHTIRAKQANNNQRQQETNRQKERAFGAEKIKQAQEEITLQKEQIRLQREYVDEITNYLAGDRKKMEDSFKGLGISLDIDSDGVITNYRAVEEELLRQENELIDAYNDGPLNDEEYTEAQKKIDEARDYLKTYEETRDLYEEQMIALIEQMDELADKMLDLTKMKVDLKIDVSDDKLEFLEYMLGKVEDDAYSVAEAISLIGDKTAENLERVDIYRSGLEELLSNKGFSLGDLDNLTDADLMAANFTQAEIDQIREWHSELLELNKELLETRDTIIDKVVDAFDELNERVKDSYDNFDNYNSILEHYKNITELMSIRLNQQNKELLNDLGRAAIANAQQQAASAYNIYKDAESRLSEAQTIYNTILEQYGPNSQEEQQYRKILETAEEDFENAQNQWLEAHENALQIVEQHYTDTIDRITKEFEQAISGLFGTLDYLQDAFDRVGTVNDEYLQDYERLYELNKLNRDIQKDIDDTNNIRNKQALRNLQAEINKLQEEGVRLSQYDVDALRKKYELEQARQAIEDARNNKSEVRLQRDANGNWGYVYTSAENEVDDAEQEYENRLYEYQKLNDEYIEELQQRALDIQKTYQEVLGEIFAPDSGLTEEERQARLEEINQWRDSELSYVQSQLENAMKNQNDLLDIYYQTYGKNWAQVADTWDETRLRMLSGFETLNDFLQNTINSMNELENGYQQALEQYKKDDEETQAVAGVSTEQWAETVATAIDDIGTNSQKTKEEIAKLSEELSDNFLSSLQSIIAWEEQYAKKIDDGTLANERFVQSINDIIERLLVLESSNPEVKAARAAYVAAEAAHEAFVQAHGENVVDNDWVKAQQDWETFITKYLAKFDTGGYTGSWGNEGKLAILHEKENIFNQKDTANLLDAAQILRTIDLSAKSFAIGFGNMLMPELQMRSEALEQNVHIEASFPNVQDHNEIELAFDNLINKASQYANRKDMSSMTFQDMYTSKF